MSLLPKYPRKNNQVRIVLDSSKPVDGQQWVETLKVMQDIWKNEETRFSALNTRGVAVITAASVILTIVGFIFKDLLPTNTGVHPSDVAKWFAAAAIGVLLLTVLTVVFAVLMPGGRSVVGNNKLTGETVGGSFAGGIRLSAAQIDNVAALEYAGIYEGLVNRNQMKAFWLSYAYLAFFIGLVAAGVAAVIALF